MKKDPGFPRVIVTGEPSTGKFYLTFRGGSTGPLTWDAAVHEVQSKVNGLLYRQWLAALPAWRHFVLWWRQEGRR